MRPVRSGVMGFGFVCVVVCDVVSVVSIVTFCLSWLRTSC